jgi:drug/metabolite transporter (DMT)-like permease
MAKLLVILLTALVFEAIGVVFLNRGLKQLEGVQRVSAPAIARLVRQGVTNRDILLGVMFEALFFAGLLVLLARSDVSFLWPLTSLGFVLTTLAARLVLHEQVSFLRWTGVCLIVIGAGLITWTEKHKPAPPPPAAISQEVSSSRPR